MVCAQCGNGAPNLESDRSTGVRPGVCRTGEKDRARAGVDRGVVGCLAGVLAPGDTARARTGVDRGELLWRGRVGGVAGVRVPRCVGGVRAHGDVAGLGVRGWQPALAGRAAPVWRSRNGVRGGSIVVAKAVARRCCATSGRAAAAQREVAGSSWSPGSSRCLSGADTASVVL